MTRELRDFVDEYMPYIDEILTKDNIPIHKRFFKAGYIFIEIAVEDSTFGSKEELLKSSAYQEAILPLFNDWYFDKYGDLARGPGGDVYSGIVMAYDQPVLIRIPATTSTVVEEGASAEMTFPDHMQKFETLEKMLQARFDLDKMDKDALAVLRVEAAEIVSLTRAMNIDLNMASSLPDSAEKMARGIWSHFEKAISDILSMKNELASIACWEIHLAIEKALKVFINFKTGENRFGHDLMALSVFAQQHEPTIDFSLIASLPSDKDAIKLRYAELIKNPRDAFQHYRTGLKLVSDIASRLDHKLGIKNASITLRKAPWAR